MYVMPVITPIDVHQHKHPRWTYFWPAMRAFSVVLLLHFLAITVAPAWIMLDFLVERDRIERELCVQRLVPDGQRTCHGQCFLMKRLQKSGERERNLPMELRAVRIGDMIRDDGQVVLVVPQKRDKEIWAMLSEEVKKGHPRRLAPVPWC